MFQKVDYSKRQPHIKKEYFVNLKLRKGYAKLKWPEPDTIMVEWSDVDWWLEEVEQEKAVFDRTPTYDKHGASYGCTDAIEMD